jgi:hypothetical protein
MFRVIAVLAGISTVLVPALRAQNPNVCVFQQKQGHSAEVDSGFDSTTLIKELITRTPALNAVGISGFTAKEIDAEAQRRNCAWVVTLERQELAGGTPNFGGTLGGTQQSKTTPFNVMVKGTKIDAGTLLEYSLRKADSRKPIAHGEGDDDSAYAKFAKAIVKKIQTEN